MKKRFSLITVLLICMMLASAFHVEAGAASWPGLSRKAYCEVTIIKNINVYMDQSLRTRGTSSPRKSYNAVTTPGDVDKVLGIVGESAIIEYPTKSGAKEGYIRKSDLFGCSAPSEYVASSGAKVTTRVKPGGNTYGYVAIGDQTWKLTTSGGWVCILYTAKSGNRALKLGWVSSGDYQAIKRGGTGGSRTRLSQALYKNSSAYISCPFDGYVHTSGRHEGIDVRLGNGKAIYSLTDGEVINVRSGYNGSNGLSTISVYISSLNKSVIYLHSNPCVRTGQKIRKGDKLGTEGWRGCSSSSGSHTHVEVRNGRKTLAAKSVGDPRLDNSNPTSFWNSLGYDVK